MMKNETDKFCNETKYLLKAQTLPKTRTDNFTVAKKIIQPHMAASTVSHPAIRQQYSLHERIN